MATELSDELSLNLSCLCRSTRGHFAVPTSLLPLPLVVCHCTICRHQSGNIVRTYFQIHPPHTSSFTVDGPVTDYKSTAGLTRSFCSSCGTNIYATDHRNSCINICSGALDWEGRDNLLSLIHHNFVSHTKDGGSSVWLPDLPRWNTLPYDNSDGDAISTSPRAAKQAISPPKQSEELQCHCHCGAVQFKITPPNEESRSTVSGPYSDLLKPYVEIAHLPQQLKERENQSNSPWHVRPPHSTRFLAGNCACHSCSKSSGFDIQSWSFVPLVNILTIDNEPIDVGLPELKKSGKLKTHHSSPGRHREFCGYVLSRTLCIALKSWEQGPSKNPLKAMLTPTLGNVAQQYSGTVMCGRD